MSTGRRNFVIRFLAGLSAVALAGCDAITNSQWGSKVLRGGEQANRGAQRALTGKAALAQEFSEADLSPDFRSNGTSEPNDATYQNLAKNQFRDWTLKIDGLVQTPQQVSLAQLRMMKVRTQITRHDCVEGWSAIGKWTGVPLSEVLALAQPQPLAHYVVFHCADPMDADGTRYYESIDLGEAHHPQTISCLRTERRGAARQERGTDPGAHRASSGLQDGEIHHEN